MFGFESANILRVKGKMDGIKQEVSKNEEVKGKWKWKWGWERKWNGTIVNSSSFLGNNKVCSIRTS
jgi:hypothetical protein